MNQLSIISGVEPQVDENYRLHRRFDRIGRLVGDAAMARLLGSHVMVIGLGGVGSFAAEALARSAVGKLTLIDFDRICTTNSNRQLQCTHDVVGKNKAEILAERLRAINPRLQLDVRPVFFSESNEDELLSLAPDYIVDAIDNITAKIRLLASCKERGLSIVCSTGASGRMDPTQIQKGDLAETRVDPLAHDVRKLLRKKYGVPAKGPFGIPAVFSTEPVQLPHELTYDGGLGFRCVCPGGSNDFHSCEQRRLIYGTAGFVTGTFGHVAASIAVSSLLQK